MNIAQKSVYIIATEMSRADPWTTRIERARTFSVLDSRSQTRNEIVGSSLGAVWTFPIPPFRFVFSCYLSVSHLVYTPSQLVVDRGSELAPPPSKMRSRLSIPILWHTQVNLVPSSLFQMDSAIPFSVASPCTKSATSMLFVRQHQHPGPVAH